MNGFKAGIISTKYPEELLMTEQMKQILEAIVDKIIDKEWYFTNMTFSSYNYMSGWLEIVCDNRTTYDWLEKIGGSLKPWVGASLIVKDVIYMPYADNLVINLPNSKNYSNKKILDLLNLQNGSLDTTNWRVIKHTEIGPNIRLIISVNQRDFRVIQGKRFTVFYKFGKVSLSLSKKTSYLYT